ncbi:pyocin activator PrtN family protein [Pseudomonas versuta]|uniref:Pyocin activator protein PrtN n=1 Tax=Pseudomonas versuta TaxID=1788301 RepID=A0ABX3E6J2_9PSED|nr:pyocin activator PrtN family protein [Pseudomonas versuta]ALE88005.1 Pyocin activator protein PrtN [Pseudomonas versuta]OKA20742.1 Pyocin activator protein PrtN [Pseudomonas versuta]
MNTQFLLLAQYGGQAIIPLERICADYFSHLTPEKMKMKVASGQIDLPLVPMERSQKSARGVHLNDLAAYLDAQHNRARTEHDKLMRNSSLRRVS